MTEQDVSRPELQCAEPLKAHEREAVRNNMQNSGNRYEGGKAHLREIGKGYTSVEEFFAALNVPRRDRQ